MVVPELSQYLITKLAEIMRLIAMRKGNPVCVSLNVRHAAGPTICTRIRCA